MRILTILLTATLLFDFHGSQAWGSPCPDAFIFCGENSKTTTAPSDAVSCSGGASAASYNLPGGTLDAVGHSGTSPHSPCCGPGILRLTEEFVVNGDPGSSVSILARLHVHMQGNGSALGAGFFTAVLKNGALQSTWDDAVYGAVGLVNRDSTLTLPVETIPGQPFSLYFSLYASGSSGGWSALHASIEFDDLPANMSVVSCRGFYQGPPVPTHPTTWGHVRARYR